MEIKWEPAGVTDDDGNDLGELFSGHVMLEVKPKMERLKLAQSLSVSMNAKGEVDIKDDTMQKVEKADEVLRGAVKSVDLKAEGVEIKSLDDLEMFEEGVLLTNEMLSVVLNGVKLGKRLSAKSKKPADS